MRQQLFELCQGLLQKIACQIFYDGGKVFVWQAENRWQIALMTPDMEKDNVLHKVKFQNLFAP